MKISKRNLQRMANGQLPEPNEDATQKIIVDGLRAHGFLVLITSRRVKKCWSCGKWPKSGKGDGVTKGVADLLIRRQTWPAGVYLSLEVKRPGKVKWSSLEQRLLAEVGDVLVVQSLEEALQAAAVLCNEFA